MVILLNSMPQIKSRYRISNIILNFSKLCIVEVILPVKMVSNSKQKYFTSSSASEFSNLDIKPVYAANFHSLGT